MKAEELNARFDALAAMTERNEHTAACIAGCDLLIELGCSVEDTRDALAAIGWDVLRVGYLPHETSDKRYALYTGMIEAAKAVFGLEAHKRFRECF